MLPIGNHNEQSTMNVHAAQPACYLTAEPDPRDPAFREQAMWCYTTIEESLRLTPGCTGCRRFKEERQPERTPPC